MRAYLAIAACRRAANGKTTAVKADLGGQVHRNHPPLSRARPEHSGC
jgi:hypothetical protein